MHESVRTSPGTRRILSISLALLIAFAFTVLLPAGTAHGEAVFYITGKGWGHGIGLSQYGAKGFAEHGWTYDGILAHYYQQTTLGTVANRSLLVNMDASKAYRLSWTLRSGRIGGSLNVGGAVTSGDHRVRFTASGSTITATDIDTGKVLGSFSGSVTVTDRSSSDYPLIEVQDATGPFTREHVNWRGAMKLVASNSALKLVNVVPLEHYLYGVVPRESISSWHMEALKAQAVAARSYAYVTDASAELYCTARSQVYGGYSRHRSGEEYFLVYETTRTNDAVNATAYQVVKYGSTIVQTFFSSMSGGYTANKEDVWGGAHYVYWSAVPDPYEDGPYTHSWGDPIVYTGTQLAAELGYPGAVASVSLERATGDWVRSATIRMADGSAYTISGTTFYSRLSLRSPKFWVSGTTPPLRFEQSDRRVVFTGSWETSEAALVSRDTHLLASGGGSSVTVPFRGSEIAWVGSRGPASGLAEVLLDGASLGTVDLYSSLEIPQAVVWSRTGLADTYHTLTIRVLGTKSTASVGTEVSVDAFDVVGALQEAGTRRFEQDDSRVSWSAGWSDNTLYWMSGRDYRYTRTAGSSVTIPFNGTSLAVIGERYSSYGQASVYVDGVYQGVADYYAPTSEPQSEIWRVSGLAAGDHTVRLVALGTANPANTSGAYAINVDAADVAGAVRDPGTVRYEQDHAGVDPVTGWSSASSADLSAGSYVYTKTAGSEIDVAFEGTSIGWIALKWPSFGKAAISIDGVYQGEVDLYAPTIRIQNQVFKASGLAPGMHRMTIRATGTKNPESLAYSICVDALDVAGSLATIVEEDDSRIAYSTEGWITGTASVLSDGHMKYSTTAGARVNVAFEGTAVSLVGNRSASYGQAKVYVDGEFAETIDLRSASTAYRQRLWSVTGLTPGAHVVTLEVVGTGAVALDAVDVIGSLVQADPPTMAGVTSYQETDTRIVYTPGWISGSSTVLSGGTMKYTATAGARAYVAFDGTEITLIGNKAKAYGTMRVTLDGGTPQTVSLYSSSTFYQQPVWSVTGLSSGPHTVVIEAVGDGTIALDALDVVGTLVQASPPALTSSFEEEDHVLYTPGWSSGSSTVLSGGTQRYTALAGASATISMSGSRFVLIGNKAKTYGTMRVTVDGGTPETVSLYSSSTFYQQAVWDSGALVNGPHTVVIEAVGDGTIALDAYKVSDAIVP